MAPSTVHDGGEEKRPLSYYHDLRKSGANYQSTIGSQIQEIDLPASETNETIRLMHIAQLIPQRSVGFYPYYDGTGFLALKHFNERSNVVVPDLSDRLQDCNLYLTMKTSTTGFNALIASKKLYSYFSRDATLETPHPAAISGGLMSSTSRALATLGGTYGIPQVSSGSTSAVLDDKSIAPLFGRTITTNKGTAEASVLYMKTLGVTHFGMIYAQDEFGLSFQSDMTKAASRHGLDYYLVGIERGSDESIHDALILMKQSERRHIYAILQEGTIPAVLGEAYNTGLVGDDYAWYLPSIPHVDFLFDRVEQFGYAEAVRGAAAINVEKDAHPAFQQAIISAVQNDTEFQSYFLKAHAEQPTVYASFNWTSTRPVFSEYSYTQYDAVMSLGIAACQAKNNHFTGKELFESFKNTSFQGASGFVAFDAETGTRDIRTLKYQVDNIVVDKKRSTSTHAAFKMARSAVVDLTADTTVKVSKPFIFHDNTNRVPKSLPKIVFEKNLIPTGVLTLGYVLSGALMLSCIMLAAWVHKYREKEVIRTSQPMFLHLILFGVFLMALSIVFNSLQEPVSSTILEAACMATPWLFFTGFATSFSAIFVKIRRLNMVIGQSMLMHRADVKIRAVLGPFLTTILINVIFLTVWTVVNPLTWTRVEVKSYDLFGRNVETFGACRGQDPGRATSRVVLSCLVALNFVAVSCVTHQAYLTRDMPSQFKESFYLFLCLAILLEAFLLGVPILFMVGSRPTAAFTVQSLLVAAICIAIMLTMFVPKLRITRTRRRHTGWGEYMAAQRKVKTDATKRSDERRDFLAISTQPDGVSESRFNGSSAFLSLNSVKSLRFFWTVRNGGSDSGGGSGELADAKPSSLPDSTKSSNCRVEGTGQDDRRAVLSSVAYTASSVAQLRANIALKDSARKLDARSDEESRSTAPVYLPSSISQLRASIARKESTKNVTENEPRKRKSVTFI
mmetsp:Transcript_6448/g.10693  ORF Transcript_6448/g.10693 Transcript_6448/m.10693 type:complete len:961 (-) Transcript_6448:502-3384(-)|eukprot:CAMPEP_0119005294 /NCGR_PEP_ID=MMETSP1176-20130426/1634_1 /TAXON_ID=265551 /ORGANISM="Synedropsis recta cf, Strain CCMP1620" /LENGTH=960 /DNA_ID=CAMNT_0006957083 /DNA_START=55 /DNA_END=2937 /DNA_ORIENTATION=-